MDDRVTPISRSDAGDPTNAPDVANYLQQPPRDQKAFEEELARHGGGFAANSIQPPFNSAETESGIDKDRLSTTWLLNGTIQWKAPALQESAPASSKGPDTHPQTKNDDTSTIAKLRAEYLVANRTRGSVDVSGLARDLAKAGDAGPAVTDAAMQRLSPENRDKLAATLDENGTQGALTGQPIAQGDAYGVLHTPNLTGLGSQTAVTPPKRTVITAGQHYGPTFKTPQDATQYAQDGLEKRRFGDSDGAAILKEGGGYSVYGARLGEQFSARALPADKADENFKAMTPNGELTALVSREGLVADYRGGQAQIEHAKSGREPSLAEKAAHYLFGDSNGRPSSAQANQPERAWTSRSLDDIEHWVNKTMPTGSQFSWANTWQAQAGSKKAQGAARKALAALGFELGENAKGAWKIVAAPAAGAGAYVLGKALIPSDIEVRVDSEGRKSNILFLDTNVHAGTVRFGVMNNLSGGILKGTTPGEKAGIITFDTGSKFVNYQQSNTLPFVLQALHNGLSAEMNLEVSFAQKDVGAHGPKDPAKAPLAAEKDTKVWLSFSFVVASEGSTYKPSPSKPASASENASGKKETWKPVKDKVTVVVQAPVDAKKIDDDTLAKLTSGNELDKVEAAAKIAVDKAGDIPIRSAFHGALIASGLRPGERIEDLLRPGMTASINTEYSSSRKLFGSFSGSLLAETKITTGMTDKGERLKFLGMKTTLQTTAEGQVKKLGPLNYPVDFKLARRPGLQVNIPLSIDNTGRISAQGISQTLDDITSKMKTAQSAPAAHPAEFAKPYTTQLEALRSGVIDEPRETRHWSADARRQVEEKWRQAMDLAHALEQ